MTRQEIYDRIKNSGKDAVVLEEMIKLGFWRTESGSPSVPEQLIQQESQLMKELNELLSKHQRFKNRELALKDMRKARMEASRKKQEENKLKRKQLAEEKARKWKETKEKKIIYLGDGVSAGLNAVNDADTERLKKNGLTDFADATQLAAAMKISLPELRFLSYHRVVSRNSHYKQFRIAKKTGGERLISAPMPRLKEAQHWILENILYKVSINAAAQGFVPGKSIVSNAQAHVKAEFLLNLDLKDFFPSVDYRRVKGMFRKLGYNEQVATIFSLLCTEAEQDEVVLDGKTYFVKSGERKLPQGAPTSPAITNIICRKMDARFAGLAKKYGFVYTRYADDLSFSASGEAVQHSKKFLALVLSVIKSENFRMHPDKLRLMRKGARKEVTGLVVNEKPAVPREKLKKFRALIYQIEKDGLNGKHWNGAYNLLAAIKGYACFMNMVDPAKSKPLVERVNKILAQHDFKHVILHKPKSKKQETIVAVSTDEKISHNTVVVAERQKETLGSPVSKTNISAANTEEKKPWWKFW